MNRFQYSLIFSLLIHVVLITAAYFTLSSLKTDNPVRKITMPVEIEHHRQLLPIKKKSINHGISNSIKIFPGRPDNTNKNVSLIKTIKFQKALINPVKKDRILLKTPEKLNTVNINKIPNFSYKLQSQYINPAGEISKNIMRSNDNGRTSRVSVSGIISGLVKAFKHKNPAVQFDFIPSKNQIIALKLLFRNKNSSQIDLYKSLDFNFPVTAELFNKELSQLVDKGFLKRKKISPQLIFNMFGVPVEISPQNIKNPIYEYKPGISQTQILTFLQAQLFLLKDKLAKSQKDNQALKNKITILKQEIQILIQ